MIFAFGLMKYWDLHVQIYKIQIISLDVWQNHIKKYDFCFRSNEVRAFESISSFYSISEIMNPDAWVWWGFWIDFVIEFSLRSDHIWRSSLMRPLNRFPYWILLEKWSILALEPNEEVGLTSLSEFLWKMINS